VAFLADASVVLAWLLHYEVGDALRGATEAQGVRLLATEQD